MDQKGLARMVIAHLEIRPSGIRPSVSKPVCIGVDFVFTIVGDDRCEGSEARPSGGRVVGGGYPLPR